MVHLFGHMGGRPIGLSDLARRLSVSHRRFSEDAGTVWLRQLVARVVGDRQGP